MALQIAQLMAAGMVIGTSTTPDRREQLKHFGAAVDLAAMDAGDSLV